MEASNFATCLDNFGGHVMLFDRESWANRLGIPYFLLLPPIFFLCVGDCTKFLTNSGRGCCLQLYSAGSPRFLGYRLSLQCTLRTAEAQRQLMLMWTWQSVFSGSLMPAAFC